MKQRLSMMALVCGLSLQLAAPVFAAGMEKTRVVRAKRAVSLALGATLVALPFSTLANPTTFATQARQQLHPIEARVAGQIAGHLQTLKQNGWVVTYHEDGGIHALAAQAQGSATKSPAVQRAMSELKKFTAVPGAQGLAHFAIHFGSSGELSVNAATAPLEPWKPVGGQIHWRFMMPQGKGVYDILGQTNAQDGARTASAWNAQWTPWGVVAQPAPAPADLSKLSP